MNSLLRSCRRIAGAFTRIARPIRTLHFKTRHTRALEAELRRLQFECNRLRQENRALLNSILGIAGIPPIDASMAPSSSAEYPRSQPASPSGPGAPAPGPVTPVSQASASLGAAATRPRKPAQLAAPLRRRSWHQINRTLELEAARKKPGAEAQNASPAGPKV